jgi:hypothetical protein
LSATFLRRFNSNCSFQNIIYDGYIKQSVEHIQTTREYFQPNKKARALEKGCIVAEKGAIGPIYEGDMLP